VPVILALDLGTTTGWALRTAGGQILSGTPGLPPAASRAAACATCGSPTWLVELAMSGTASAGSGVRGGQAACRHRRRPCLRRLPRHAHRLGEEHVGAYQGVPVGTIKRHVTGRGNADKAAMIAAVRARGFKPADDNEADALALLLWAIETAGGVR
jgi:hypothetical protein